MSIDFTNFALASEALPQANVDLANVEMRSTKYGEQLVVPAIQKSHPLANEGSYFVTNNNNQTGILSSAATGFVATTPALIIYNKATPGQGAKRIYLDFVKLVTTVVGSAASGLVRLEGATYTDVGNRYSSGGTELTANIISPNQDLAAGSIARVFFGALTATAASAARAIDPYHVIRATVSGTVVDVVGEQKYYSFGSVETMFNGSITVANANNIPIPQPPVIIGPNQSFVLYIWQAVGATNVAATYSPNIGWWER